MTSRAGGRPVSISAEQIDRARALVASGVTWTRAAKEVGGVHPGTLRKAVRRGEGRANPGETPRSGPGRAPEPEGGCPAVQPPPDSQPADGGPEPKWLAVRFVVRSGDAVLLDVDVPASSPAIRATCDRILEQGLKAAGALLATFFDAGDQRTDSGDYRGSGTVFRIPNATVEATLYDDAELELIPKGEPRLVISFDEPPSVPESSR